jgi:hypothetical protein
LIFQWFPKWSVTVTNRHKHIYITHFRRLQRISMNNGWTLELNAKSLQKVQKVQPQNDRTFESLKVSYLRSDSVVPRLQFCVYRLEIAMGIGIKLRGDKTEYRRARFHMKSFHMKSFHIASFIYQLHVYVQQIFYERFLVFWPSR